MRERCESFLERMGRYVDGELEPDAAREMENHLGACPGCRRAHEELTAADRLLREGVLAETTDQRAEEKAAARLLARLREEPEPEWARRRQDERRGDEPGTFRKLVVRIRSRRLGPALGWAGGLAAATAAVILAVRLGMPERPVTTETPAKAKIEQAPAAKDLAREQERPETSRPRSTEAPPASGGAVSPGTPPVGQPAPSQEANRFVGAEEDAATISDQTPAQVTLEIESEVARGQGPHVTHFQGERRDETDLQIDEPRPTPAEEGTREKSATAVEKKGADEPEETHVAAPVLADRASGPTETWGRVRSLSEGPAALDSDLELRASAVDSTDQGVLSPNDTLLATIDLAERLERGTRALSGMSDSDLEPAERARRWRVIGDLWEWLARRDGAPILFDRALRAYETGLALDPEAGAPDSIRLASARAGASQRPNPSGSGNKVPDRR